MQGEPFKYFAYGAAVSEVEVDGFTGAYRLRRVDIVHDVGDSLSPLIDLGQIEGGFVQGAGWLTLEELRWDESDGPNRGRLNTQAASTYKIPSFSEMPEEFNVHLFERATESGVVYGSKAVGEPPLMLAFSVREALRQAVGAFGPAGWSVDLGCPSTPEAVYWAIEAARGAAGTAGAAPRPRRSRGSEHGLARARSSSCGTTASPACWSRWSRCAGTRRATPAPRWWSAPTRTWGSVGGGNLEEVAVARARELIVRVRRSRRCRSPGSTEHARNRARPAVLRRRGHGCCSSRCRPGRSIAIFGVGPRRLRAGPDPVPAGGPAASGRLPRRPARRAAAGRRHRRRPPTSTSTSTLLGEPVLERLPRGAHVLIMTHDHAEDFALCDAALRLPQPLGSDRADRVGREVVAVPGPAGRRGSRPGADRPDHLPDRPARDHRQGAGGDRRRGRRRPAGQSLRRPGRR